MTQRIFDMDNPQDIKDLFDILPDAVKKIYKDTPTNEIEFYDKDGDYIDSCSHIRVNWHGKTLITRPVNESKWIGCLCWFADDTDNEYIGVLHATRNGDDSYPYICKNGLLRSFNQCRPVRRDEVKFVEDVE